MARFGTRVVSGFGLGLGLAALVCRVGAMPGSGQGARGPAAAQDSNQAGLGPVVSRIDRLLTEAYPADKPGAAVLVSKAGVIILKKGYGLAHVERKGPATPDTAFRLASVTKAFTGTTVARSCAAAHCQVSARGSSPCPTMALQSSC